MIYFSEIPTTEVEGTAVRLGRNCYIFVFDYPTTEVEDLYGLAIVDV